VSKKTKTEEPKQRNRQIAVEVFLPRYLEALDQGTHMPDFAHAIGMTQEAVRQRVYVMRLRGHDIEYLPSGSSHRAGRCNDSAITSIMREHAKKKGGNS
jgi:hypothetical protein